METSSENTSNQKIPILNIYYMLCYAWKKLGERDIVNVQGIDCMTLQDLLARVLINGTNHLIKRGLDRSYLTEHEWTGRLRGRICFSELVQVSGAPTCKLPCDFDELSHDVLHNQILRATFRRLRRLPLLDKKNAKSLDYLYRLLAGVRDIELSARIFGHVRLHRNNQFYDFLLKICELIYHNLLVTETKGSSKFADFYRDKQMGDLFENFILEFYRKESDYRVEAKKVHWRWRPEDDASQTLLPEMKTDICLERGSRQIIIDCKFTRKVTQQYLGPETLRSGHLYQINAYMTNLTDEYSHCEMMLLYAEVDKPLNATYNCGDHKISIRTINLNQEWKMVEDHLKALLPAIGDETLGH